MNKTTADFIRIKEMGYPAGCDQWTHAETYGNHRVWRSKQRTRINRMMIAAVLLTAVSVAASMGVGQ